MLNDGGGTTSNWLEVTVVGSPVVSICALMVWLVNSWLILAVVHVTVDAPSLKDFESPSSELKPDGRLVSVTVPEPLIPLRSTVMVKYVLLWTTFDSSTPDWETATDAALAKGTINSEASRIKKQKDFALITGHLRRRIRP
jgi:hypothetical protein